MLGFFSLVVALGVAYAYLNEGMFTAFVMFCNVLLAGLLAYNFWEPLANQLDYLNMMGYEDFVAMILIFVVSLAALRTITNILDFSLIEYDLTIQRIGGAFFGFLAGYLTAGFFLCALQTLPWEEHFMGFEPTYDPDQHPLRHYLPPDRVWLALMRTASDGGIGDADTPDFDEASTFELRYSRYRRYSEARNALPYTGELDRELKKLPPPPPEVPQALSP